MAPCDAAVYGAAAGTASVMLDGTGIVTREMIDSILPQMTSKGIR